MNPAIGIHFGVPWEGYNGWPAWGNSDLKMMRRGPPSMVPWRRAHPQPDTAALRLGRAVHCAILEPDRFLATFTFKPEGMKFSTKEGMAWRDDPIRRGKTIMAHEESDTVEAILEAFRAKLVAEEELARALAFEASLLWKDEETGATLKARPDWYTADCLYDLKLCRLFSPGAASYAAWKQGWFHQLAHYRAGLNALGHKIRLGRIVAVDPEPPHSVWCLELKTEALDLFALDNLDALKKIAVCAATNDWPGTPDFWDVVDMPAAALESFGNAIAYTGID